MDRRSFMKLAGFSAASLLFPARPRATAAKKTNVLMIYADDLGYGDLACYGSKLVPTPNLDRLAASGLRCTDGYVTMNVCAPSRCGLMSGAYQQRFGMQNNTDRNAPTYVIPPEHKLMPEAFKAAGYVTGHIGKWNIQRDPKAIFDEVHSLIDWEADYYSGTEGHYIGVDGEHASGKRQGEWGPWHEGDEYLTDRLARQAVEFIEAHKSEPFFLYLAFNAVHSPWQAPKEYNEKLAQIPEKYRFYAAMIIKLDENVGKVLEKLKAAGLEENTILAFVSDNGPAFVGPGLQGYPPSWPKEQFIMGSAGPLNGHKGQFYEGGIREPFIVRWPGHLKPGVYSKPVITMDLYPTFCAAAGVPTPAGTKLDGVNLLPYLGGEKSGAPHEILFWKAGASGAVRQGDWKLLMGYGYAPKPQLFNLKEDIGEKHDLAEEKPEMVTKLLDAWKAWSAPFPPATAGKAKKKAGQGKAKAGQGQGKGKKKQQ